MEGKYFYYMLERPYGPGCQPAGVVDWLEYGGGTVFPEIERHAWAIVSYDRELTDEELEHYSMRRSWWYGNV